MGNKTVIRAGDVQRMSAGTGLTHSEFNLASGPVHFYQIWILPDKAGLRPTYDQKSFAPKEWKNRLLPVASGQNLPDAVTFHTDATIYRCQLDDGQEVALNDTAGRYIFIYVRNGHLSANDSQLASGDQARISIDEPLVLKAAQQSEFILIDLSASKR